MPKLEIHARPFRVSLLAFLILMVSFWNVLRLGQALIFWSILNKYGGRPLFDAISGGAWFLVGIFLFFGLWRGKYWSWHFTIGATFSFEVYYWLDRILLQEQHANWPFVLVTSFIVFSFFIFILFSYPTKQYCSQRCL
jgi:hypothetical protein